MILFHAVKLQDLGWSAFSNVVQQIIKTLDALPPCAECWTTHLKPCSGPDMACPAPSCRSESRG